MMIHPGTFGYIILVLFSFFFALVDNLSSLQYVFHQAEELGRPGDLKIVVKMTERDLMKLHARVTRLSGPGLTGPEIR